MTVFIGADRVYSALLTRINMLSAMMIFGFVLLITADVIARTAFFSPIQGVAEIVGNGMVVLCFMQIPYVLMKGLHVRTTIFYDKVGHRTKCVLDIFALILGMIAYILIVYASWGVMLRAIEINDAELAGTVRITNIPGRIAVVAGSTMMAVECALLAVKNVIKIKNPSAFDDKKPPQSAQLKGGNNK